MAFGILPRRAIPRRAVASRYLCGRRRGGVGMLAAAERRCAHRLGAIVDSGQLAALAPALVADDDEPQLGALSSVPGGTAVGTGVVAGDRHLTE
jgi:hypothetical protein